MTMILKAISLQNLIMKNQILLLSLLSAITFSARAEWSVLEQTDKQGVKHYVDWSTIDENDHLRRMWILSSYMNQQPGQFRSLKTHYELNCVDSKARTITLLLYPDENASTTPNGARHAESEDWFDFSKQSILNQIAQKICKKEPQPTNAQPIK